MSELKSNKHVILSQSIIAGRGDRKSKYITIANDFLNTLSTDVRELSKQKKCNQVVFCPTGSVYLTRYLNEEERSILNKYVEKIQVNEEFKTSPEFLADACTSDFEEIHTIGSVPMIRVSEEGFTYLISCLSQFFFQIETLLSEGTLDVFDLKDIINRPQKHTILRDSIFSTLINLSKVYITSVTSNFTGYNATTSTIDVLCDWHDMKNEDFSVPDISARTKKFPLISKEKKLRKKLECNPKLIKDLLIRCLAFISVMAGRKTVDNNFDCIIYLYNKGIETLRSDLKCVGEEQFFEHMSKYHRSVPSFMNMYTIPIYYIYASVHLSTQYGREEDMKIN